MRSRCRRYGGPLVLHDDLDGHVVLQHVGLCVDEIAQHRLAGEGGAEHRGYLVAALARRAARVDTRVVSGSLSVIGLPSTVISMGGLPCSALAASGSRCILFSFQPRMCRLADADGEPWASVRDGVEEMACEPRHIPWLAEDWLAVERSWIHRGGRSRQWMGITSPESPTTGCSGWLPAVVSAGGPAGAS